MLARTKMVSAGRLGRTAHLQAAVFGRGLRNSARKLSLTVCIEIAARAALRRKKQHEHTLDQTVAQISTLEQQIYSIEAANINRETLAAMEKAGAAMKQIHGKLNIDTVDETMYVYVYFETDRKLHTDIWSKGETS
jgi:hypothetical protein